MSWRRRNSAQQVITERESWIIDNLDKNPGLSVEENAKMVEPGLEFAPQDFRDALYKEVKGVIDSIYAPTARARGSRS